MPAISVAIPTYNNARYLTGALDSVLSQSFTDYEVIVVDDGSSDDTDSVLGPYRSRIRYHRQDNQGIGAARNVVLRMAAGEMIAFLDSDDRWDPDHLLVTHQVLTQHPELGAVFGDFRIIDGDGRTTHESGIRFQFSVFDRLSIEIADVFERAEEIKARNRRYRVRAGDIFDTLFLGNFILPSSMVVRRALARQIGDFRPMRTQEDYEWLLRLAKHHELAFVEEPLVSYRRHPSQLTSYARLESILLAANEIIGGYEAEFRSQRRSKVFDRRKAGLALALGTTYLRQGRKQEARRAIAESFRRSPGHLPAYFHHALSFLPHRLLAALAGW
jgi:glycosyltransferase involved in cell wall biosynthesis